MLFLHIFYFLPCFFNLNQPYGRGIHQVCKAKSAESLNVSKIGIIIPQLRVPCYALSHVAAPVAITESTKERWELCYNGKVLKGFFLLFFKILVGIFTSSFCDDAPLSPLWFEYELEQNLSEVLMPEREACFLDGSYPSGSFSGEDSTIWLKKNIFKWLSLAS